MLVGDLGAGKTTFAQGIARGLGVDGPVTSPTFTFVQEYDGRLPVAHVDVYRLERIQELHDLGFEELIDGPGVTIIEWGDASGRCFRPSASSSASSPADADDARALTFEFEGARLARRTTSGRRSRRTRRAARSPVI